MKKTGYIVFSIIFILFAHATNAQTTDLDNDGIPDNIDPEVILSTDQTLSAGEYNFINLTIQGSTTLTLESNPQSTEVFKGVKIAAQNITIDTGAYISADRQGYPLENGPGLAPSSIYGRGGSGHGGAGGPACSHGLCRPGGPTYGSSLRPKELGSDGGGGAIWLIVSETLTNNGVVSTKSNYRGSGGSIFVETNIVSGGGKFFAGNNSTARYDIGGGGRIAIHYQNSTFTGTTEASVPRAGDGTVCFLDTINNHLYVSNNWVFVQQDSPYVFDKISVIKKGSVSAENNVEINTKTLSIDDGVVSFTNNQLINIPNIKIQNNSLLTLSGKETLNTEEIILTNNSTLTHVKEGKLYLNLTNLFVDNSSQVSADYKGYLPEKGPGLAPPNKIYGHGGAGHGGAGGPACSHGFCRPGGPTYGSSTKPTNLGSDGGGGAIRIIAKNIINNGRISAMGIHHGSGGSIYITTKNLDGNGSFSASNNETLYDIGGGGRIAIYYDISTFTGEINVRAPRAKDGTIVFKQNKTAPTLAYAEGLGYKEDLTSPGTHPNKGIANKDKLTFKTTYKDKDNTPADIVATVITNTVDFNTKFYTQHLTLDKNATFINGSETNNLPVGKTFVGSDVSILDGNAITTGNSVTATMLQKHTRKATTTIIITLQSLGVGDAYADITIEALDINNTTIGSSSLHIPINLNGPQNKQIDIGVEANTDIQSIKLTANETNDTAIWIQSYTLTSIFKMTEHDENYETSLSFPKGKYSYYFIATSTDGLTARLPKTGNLSFTTGYSNIAFLPGIKASRLYNQGKNFENQLWEPNRNSDPKKLMIKYNPITGSTYSSSTYIYTKNTPKKGLVDEINIISPTGPKVSDDVYINFINKMNKFVESKTIKEWKSLPYDWRLDFNDLLNGGELIDDKIYYDKTFATNTPYILQEISRLAKMSDSGKVTIVAHSMGGLVAKKLLYDIEANTHPYHNLLKDMKIDSLILVASPQLGTPLAIPALLHGYKEDKSFAGYKFIKKDTARLLANSMQPTYNLLPAEIYTEKISDLDGIVYRPADSALISFDSTTLSNLDDTQFNTNNIVEYYRKNYNESSLGTTTIRSYNAMCDFLIGKDGHSSATNEDTKHPKLLHSQLLEKAKTLHRKIDTWQSPDINNDGLPDIHVVQIAGWGIADTVKGMTYFAKQEGEECKEYLNNNCVYTGPKWVLDLQPNLTHDGDGTVVLPSAIAMGETSNLQKGLETYYMDLYTYNRALLGAQINRKHANILEINPIQNLIKNIIQNKTNPSENIEYIYTNQTDLPKENSTYLRLAMHSPVDVHIYDSKENHVGTSEDYIDEKIPNSYYLEFGEGKYLGIPMNANEKHTIKLEGTGTGTFTFEINEENNDVIQKTRTFSNIPVSTTTISSLTFSSLDEIKELVLDYDGDGNIDKIALTNEYKKTITFDTLNKEIEKLQNKTKRILRRKSKTAEKQFSKKHYLVTQKILKSMQRYIQGLTNKHIPLKYRIPKEASLYINAILNVLIDNTHQKYLEQEKGWKEKYNSLDKWNKYHKHK